MYLAGRLTLSDFLEAGHGSCFNIKYLVLIRRDAATRLVVRRRFRLVLIMTVICFIDSCLSKQSSYGIAFDPLRPSGADSCNVAHLQPAANARPWPSTTIDVNTSPPGTRQGLVEDTK